MANLIWCWTRGFASLTLVRFAFISWNDSLWGSEKLVAIGGFTEQGLLARQ